MRASRIGLSLAIGGVAAVVTALGCGASGTAVYADGDARALPDAPLSPPPPDDANGPDPGQLAPISRFAFVHGAPGLPAVRLCFRSATGDVLDHPWPSQGTLPASNYPGLAPGGGVLMMDPSPLMLAGPVTVDVYDAYAAAQNDRPKAASCAELRMRSVTILATIGPLTFGAPQGVVLLQPCKAGGDAGADAAAGPDAGADAGACGGGHSMALVPTTLSPGTNQARWTVAPMLLTNALPAGLELVLEGKTTEILSSDLGQPRSVTVDEPAFEGTSLVLRDPSKAEVGRWTLRQALEASDPRTLPSELFGLNPVLVGVVGDPKGTGPLALHPLLLPFDATR